MWLKFFTVAGRFPTGRAELPDEAVGYVASQVKVAASDLGLFDWVGRTAERHRKAVRTFLGFRECSVPQACLARSDGRERVPGMPGIWR